MQESYNTNNPYKELFSETKKYIELQTKLFKLESVEKSGILLSTLIFLMLAVVFCAGLGFYLMFTLAYLLEPVMGLMWSFLVISGFYLLLIIILFLFKKKLIINPIIRFLSQLFLNENDTL
ncbi:MAG: phage holin family protein [Bacteroidaceae bacterium]|nr:phage holin family protein [Bacteroidaceae bacterium]